MGSSPKGGGGGGGGGNKAPTVVPHTTSAPMTNAMKTATMTSPMATSSMKAASLPFVPGQDGGPALPKPYEYKRNQLAQTMKKKKYNYRDTWGDRERASDSGYGSRGYAGGGGLY